MFAEGSSPPPESENLSIITTPSTFYSNTNPPLQAQTKKRKRAQATASSPVPSDTNNTDRNNPTELLVSRADLSSRPILTISRGPLFLPTVEGSEYYKTDLIGVNRVGYRYIPAGINPPGHTNPCRTIESNPTSFRVSWEDRSPFLKVTKDGLGIAGSKGFRSARCNAPMREGKWYMEVKIVHGGGEHIGDETTKEGSHVRLGWGRREASLNGPVGLDGYSYGYRDKTGDKVTLSRPRPYGRSFGTGDVVGMYISLPPRREAAKNDLNDPAHIKRERIPIDLKGQEVFEILEYPQSKEMAALMDYSGKSTSSASVPSAVKKPATGKLPERGHAKAGKPTTPALRPLPTLSDSRIAFFVNGECQGVAFRDIYDHLQLKQTETQRKSKEKKRAREGVKEHRENPFDDGTLGYYPFISLFNDACVHLNPGPNFDFPPPSDIDAVLDGNAETMQSEPTWRPACERYSEFMKEQWALDALEEEQARAEAAHHAALDLAEDQRKTKRRKQAETKRRKKAEQASWAAITTNVGSEEGAFGPLVSLNQPSPSPLRYSTAFEPEGSVEYEMSPAPTFASYGEFQGNQSGYNSEAHDVEMDQDMAEDQAGTHTPITAESTGSGSIKDALHDFISSSQ